MSVHRKACTVVLSILFVIAACSPPTPLVVGTSTPRPKETANASATETPGPATSSLNVQKEALRGAQVNVWHPWFGAEASLFESQVAQFNTENEWGIVVSAQSQGNFMQGLRRTTRGRSVAGGVAEVPIG